MKMKCVITGVNIKVFARAVHSLARLGDELYVEPSTAGVSFHTVNSSRSAFASFLFGSRFFSQFDGSAGCSHHATAGEASSREDDGHTMQQADTIKCKVAMKAFLCAFKSLSSVEKNVERCKITLDGGAAKLLLQLWCRNSVVRTYNLAFIECETVKAVFDESACVHRITAQSRLLSDIFVNFQPGQDEVSLSVTAAATTVRNYVDDEPDMSKVIRTELHLESDEFDEYEISSNCEIVFCLKEFRALLAFSEPVNLPITIVFSQPGRPIILNVENKPLYECKFVLATLVSPNLDSQATTAPQNASANTFTKSKPTCDQNQTVEHHQDHDKQHARPTSPPVVVHNNSFHKSSLGGLHAVGKYGDSDGIQPGDGDASNIQPDNDIRADRSATEQDIDVSNVVDVLRVVSSSAEDHGTRRDINESDALNGATLITPRSSNDNSNVRTKRLSRMLVRNSMFDRNKEPLSNVCEQSEDVPRISCSMDKSKVLTTAGRHRKNATIVPSDGEEEECVDQIPNGEDNFPGAPPTKKYRPHFLFDRCFNSTFDPTSVDGYDVILAKDSDTED
uniref:Cell cycle checkpoint control protein RAD9A n=1 Tax=Hirondellea gigas TaxID=1518452 RepID=A0A2P2I770_9CRUS